MSTDPRHDDISPDDPEPCAYCGMAEGWLAETRDGVFGWRCAACGAWTAYDEPEAVAPSAWHEQTREERS